MNIIAEIFDPCDWFISHTPVKFIDGHTKSAVIMSAKCTEDSKNTNDKEFVDEDIYKDEDEDEDEDEDQDKDENNDEVEYEKNATEKGVDKLLKDQNDTEAV